jgi:hypothetical protein
MDHKDFARRDGEELKNRAPAVDLKTRTVD